MQQIRCKARSLFIQAHNSRRRYVRQQKEDTRKKMENVSINKYITEG